VTIIRGGDDAGKVEVVNVSQALATGQIDRLPKVRRQDTIEIPRTPASVPSGDLVQSTEKRNIIYVIGAVARPGPIQYDTNIDVLEALALAGGPSPDADLRKVKVVSKDGYYAQSFRVDLDKYAESGRPVRYLLRQEDTFVVPRKGGGIFGVSLGTAGAVLGVLSSAFLIIDRIQQ
jgi:polysaccharide export outer membrane protein